jgi:predicted nucleic acid-binding protein
LRSVVIADAGPLIALSRIDALVLLRHLFGQVLVTEEVRDEALPAANYPGKALIAQAFEAGWLACPGPFETSWQPTNPGIDAGERSAIAAALKMPGCLLVIDDRAGRAEAKSHHIAIIGTAAVIGLAKLQGLIPAARPVLDRLQPAGYFIHPRIIETVMKDVGE